ncbi:MAG TPA: GNAT family N-acetyltransferase [Bacteroides sp.]|nr:GNAT family N-acetyltransferase [Bacteroides sp.]
MKAAATNSLIRNFRPEDYPSLLELWQKTDLTPPERGDNEEVIKRCNDHGGQLLVIEDTGSGKIIGSSWMTWDGRRIYLHHFGILPDFQRRGLGTELAKKSLEWIQQKGQQVKLEVHKKNHAAKRLYEKLGFFAFRDYDIYMIREFES